MATTSLTKSAGWKKVSGSVLGLLALLGLLIAVNVLLSSFRLRADLTRENLYTLSSGTRAILGKLQNDVELKFFFSSSAPEVPEYLKSYARQVEDLLQEYRRAAGGRIRVDRYDPKPDSDAEELAQRYGISGQAVNIVGPTMYFGLAAVSGAAEAALPVLDPRQDTLLEYNLTRLIHRVANPEKTVLGIMSSLPVLGRQAPPFMMPNQPRPEPQPAWLTFRDLKEDYDVREIPVTAEDIDADIDLLVLIHPKDLGEQTLYAIDQFVLGGGRLLAFLDPMCLVDLENSGPQQQPFGMPRASSDLEQLLDAWGIAYDPGQVVVDFEATTRIRGRDNRAEDSPTYLSLREANLSSNEVVSAQIESLLFPFAGSFSGDGVEGITVTPLVMTSETSQMVDGMMAQMGGDMLRRRFKSGMTHLPLAVRLSGTFPTAFPDGPPQGEDGAEDGDEGATNETAQASATPTGLKESAGTSIVLLVADVDVLYDAFCARQSSFLGYQMFEPINDNMSFFINAVEQLSGSEDFIHIRCRGKTDRPFTRVLALQRQAQERWMLEEMALQEKLEETQRRLNELQSEKDDSQRYILSPQQQKEVAKFKEENRRIERRLREVRKSLREGIERLGAVVKTINILLVPALVSLGGLAFGFYRRRRARR